MLKTYCVLAALTFGADSVDLDCSGSFRSFRKCNQYLVLHAQQDGLRAGEDVTFRCVRAK